MTNDTTGEGNLTCLLVLVDMAASKLENNDNLMKLLALAQADASKLEDENEELRKDVKYLEGCYQILYDRAEHDFGWAVQTDDQNDKLRKLCADLYAEMLSYSNAPSYNASVWAPKLRKLGIEVD